MNWCDYIGKITFPGTSVPFCLVHNILKDYIGIYTKIGVTVAWLTTWEAHQGLRWSFGLWWASRVVNVAIMNEIGAPIYIHYEKQIPIAK